MKVFGFSSGRSLRLLNLAWARLAFTETEWRRK
jgi:hypothetical protein